MKAVKKKMEENSRKRWKAGMEDKLTMRWYKIKEKPEALQGLGK